MKPFKTIITSLLWLLISLNALSHNIITFAGGGSPGDGGQANSAELYDPTAVFVDGSGNIFIADSKNNRIREVTASGNITTVAGNGSAGFIGDGGAATSAELNFPTGIFVDGSGNLFIADAGNNRIRKVGTSGNITTVAGGGTSGIGDGGPATSALLYQPTCVFVDGSGNIFIADSYNYRIRKVTVSGNITTVAGTGNSGSGGDGGPATSAPLGLPTGVYVDGSGNIFIADPGVNTIHEVNTSGIIVTLAGQRFSAPGYSGDGGPATQAVLSSPYNVFGDRSGNIFIADERNSRIRVINTTGNITTVAGSGTGGLGNGGPATSAELYNPTGVFVGSSGNIFIADKYNNMIREVTTSGNITTVAGDGIIPYFGGDGGAATLADLHSPNAVFADGSGNIFIADAGNNRIRKVSPSGIITTVAGGGTGGLGDGGPATSAELNNPSGLFVDGFGNIFIADTDNNRIREVTASGNITTVAGGGIGALIGDGGPATSAILSYPTGVFVDGSGNIFVADTDNDRIREVTSSGNITTVAGNGSQGFNGNGEPATSAELWAPYGVFVDGSGNIYIAQFTMIRMVNTSGNITTVAGNGSLIYTGDGIAATSTGISTLLFPLQPFASFTERL